MPSCSPTASPAPSPISSVSAARQLLARLALPEPWQGTLEASLRLIDELDREIGDCERELRRLGADHRYLPLLCTVPGISWVLADTIAAELGDIDRFPTPRKVAQVDLARRLAEAIWHMLSRNQPLAPGRRHRPPGRLTALKEMRHRSELPSAISSHQEAIER